MFYFHGAKDTRKHSGGAYREFTFDHFCKRAEDPSALPKNKAVAVIFSRHNGQFARNSIAQIEQGDYQALAGDIDKGSPSLEQLDQALLSVFGDVRRLIYSSSSATPTSLKWRFVIPLSQTLPGHQYRGAQETIISLMADEGITLDPALKTPTQPIYAPNVPPNKRDEEGKPIFYEWFLKGNVVLANVNCVSGFNTRRSLLTAQPYEAQQATNKVALEKAAVRQRLYQITGVLSPVEHFNMHHDIHQILVKYGWLKLRKGYASPNSSSKGESVYVVDQRAFSFTGSDKGVVGHEGPSCVTYDAFDVYVFAEHGGGFRAAVKAYAAAAGLQQQVFQSFYEEFKKSWT